MLEITDFFYFYRILDWGGKTSFLRLFLYTALGYLMAGNFNPLLILLNSLAVFGVLAFWYSQNNYYDWKIIKEENFLSYKIRKGDLNEKKSKIYIFSPLILCVSLFGIVFFNLISPLIFILFFLLALIYNQPPIRIKEKSFWGFFIPIIIAPLLFLQGYFLLEGVSLNIFLFTILLLIFQSYAEVIHTLEHSLVKEEKKRIGQKNLLKLLKVIPLISFLISFLFSFHNLIFFITSFFSFVRLFSLKGFRVENTAKIRRNIFLPQWSLYEFLIYGAFGAFHLI